MIVLLVLADVVQAQAVEVLDRRAQRDGLRDHRRAGLEAVRRLGVGRALHRHGLDHLAAPEERRQVLEQVVAAPQHADAAGSVQLVPGEGDEVGAEVLHVQRQVRGGLRGVDDGQRADRLGPRHDALHRVDGARARWTGGRTRPPSSAR